jgi:hypothetical protein
MIKAKHYYESHVTIEPVFEDKLEEVKRISFECNFKVANLLFKKRETDTEERSTHDTFTTGHSKYYEDIVERTKRLVVSLQHAGYTVWRYKIEDTMMDSRIDDEFNLLNRVEM